MSPPDAYLVAMQRWLTQRFGHGPPALDEQTVERLLSGLPAADAPPAYARAAQALAALGQDARPAELLGESGAVPAIASTVSRLQPVTPRRATMFTKIRTAKVAAATAVGVLGLTTGLAAAGALPGAAQDVASSVLSKVGISTPGPDSHAGDHPNTRGASPTQTTSTPPTTNTPPDTTKGSQISGLATTTAATGVDKGAQISTAASNGQSQAGQHGNPPSSVPPSGPPAGPPNSVPPVSVPNGGGASTGNQASDGHSSAGAGNASNGPSHRP
jgi:hypothetical protein